LNAINSADGVLQSFKNQDHSRSSELVPRAGTRLPISG